MTGLLSRLAGLAGGLGGGSINPALGFGQLGAIAEILAGKKRNPWAPPPLLGDGPTLSGGFGHLGTPGGPLSLSSSYGDDW